MIGDVTDIVARLKLVLPKRWFGDQTPVLDAVLAGLATGWTGIFGLIQYLRAQARIMTASGVFLDIAARDYLGGAILRRMQESDASFSRRIRAQLLAGRATRASLSQALLDLTGRSPWIFEPRNATDTGGYNVNLGYNLAGGYGSLMLPQQVFVVAYRPLDVPQTNTGGYNTGPGGYNAGPMAYTDPSAMAGAVGDAEIYATIATVMPTVAVAWTKISN